MRFWTDGRYAAVLDQALVSGSNFLLVFLCARRLLPEEQGKFGYILSVYFAATLLSVSTVFQWATIEAVSTDDQSGYRKSIAAFQIYLALVATVLMTTILAFLGRAAGWDASIGELVDVAAFLLLQQLADFDRRSAYLFSRPWRAFLSSSIMHPARLLALYVLAFRDIEKVLPVLMASAFVPAVLTVRSAGAELFARNRILHFAISHLKNAKWLAIGGWISWLWGNSATFVVGHTLGLSTAAVLVTLRSATNVINVAIEMLETYVPVVLVRKRRESLGAYRHAVVRIVSGGVGVWVVGMTILYFEGQSLVAYLFGSFYSPYWYLMFGLWTVNLAIFGFKLSSIHLRSLARTGGILISYVVGLLAVLVVIFPAINWFGLDGAVGAMVVSSVVLVASIGAFAARGTRLSVT